MIHRRSLLAAAASAPLAGLAGSFAQATPVDPHPVWMEQWRQARADWEEAAKTDDDGCGPACTEAHKRELLMRDRIIKTEALTQEGINAQIRFLAEDFGHDLKIDFGEKFLASICGEFA